MKNCTEWTWLCLVSLVLSCNLAGLGLLSAQQPAHEEKAAAVSSPKASEQARERAQARAALEEFNALIGGWRGVGQPKRNSSKDAWTETGEWVWEISKSDASLHFTVKEGKLLHAGVLTYDIAKKRYTFAATLPDKSKRTYSGTLAGKKLALETEPDDSGKVHQIVLTLLNEKRTLILFQERRHSERLFTRIAEVGYTREGTKLAEEGGQGPECIVTGGKGTISMTYKGKTYWFCCTGCQGAFQDDPEGILAEAAERLRRERRK
jgi:YHS domain-containing protein